MGVGVGRDCAAGDGGAGKTKENRKGAQHFMFPGGKNLGMPLTDLADRLGDFSADRQRGGAKRR